VRVSGDRAGDGAEGGQVKNAPKHVWVEVCNVDGSAVEFWWTKKESRGWRAVETRLVKYVLAPAKNKVGRKAK